MKNGVWDIIREIVDVARQIDKISPKKLESLKRYFEELRDKICEYADNNNRHTT